MPRILALVLLMIAASVFAAEAPPDTLDLYGGPGTLEGKFETTEGEPDEQGWTSFDETGNPVGDLWSITNRDVAGLDPGQPDNHAWWCGQDIPACSPEDSAWGYGNDWEAELGWTRAVDPTRIATVTITGVLKLDTEYGYDFGYVSWIRSTDFYWMNEFVASGAIADSLFSYTMVYQAGEYVGENDDEVRLAIRFQSDGAYSDEDCSWAGAGALQVDNLQVTIQQPGLPDYVSPVETCEPGTTPQWSFTDLMVGTGDFAMVRHDLGDVDPLVDNDTPQWTFINSGQVPGVPASTCDVNCYGPGGYVIYNGPDEARNTITSPPIELPVDWDGGLVLSFSAYLQQSQGFFCLGRGMMATSDPSGVTGWTLGFDNVCLVGPTDGAGKYSRLDLEVPADLVPPDSRWVRIVLYHGYHGNVVWPFNLTDTPAPYLDNVRLQLAPPSVAEVPGIPGEFTASAAPNPFNPKVVIRWNLPQAEDLAVKIHDTRGRLVKTLRSGAAAAGPGEITWQGRDDNGQGVAAGVYFCRVESATEKRVIKVTMLK